MEQLWDVHLRQTLCDANRLSHSCQRKFNQFCFFFFFVYRVVSIQGFGRETPHRSAPTMEAWYTPTLPNRSRLCPHLHSTCIDLMPSDVVTHVNYSILRKQRNKKKHHHRLLFQFLPTRPTFSGSSLDGDDGKLGQTEEENRIGTNRHPRHGTALGTRRAVIHLRRLRTSTPVSRLKPSLFQWPFQHFPIPFDDFSAL